MCFLFSLMFLKMSNLPFFSKCLRKRYRKRFFLEKKHFFRKKMCFLYSLMFSKMSNFPFFSKCLRKKLSKKVFIHLLVFAMVETKRNSNKNFEQKKMVEIQKNSNVLILE